MKVAFIQDWLTSYGGAEKCIEALCEVWPEADIYTLVYRQEIFNHSIISGHKVYTSFIQSLPWSKTKFRHYFMLYPFAVEQYDLNEYDVVISFSAAFSHGVITSPNQLHICYKHTPMRYAWNGYHEYLQDPQIRSKWKNWLTRHLIHRLRRWDFQAAQRPDLIIANSEEVRRRIWKYYRRRAIVIYPPVEVDKFSFSSSKAKGNYYFTMSRMVPYKRIDLIVKAFIELGDKKLIVAGDGPEMGRLKKIARDSSNIEFVGFVNDKDKIELMQKAKAFIFSAHEDFGIAPVEAQACGIPIIAYGKGGALETVVDNKTGIFFNAQRIEELKKTVFRFEELKGSFNPTLIRKNAEKFSQTVFKNKIKKYVKKKLEELQNGEEIFF